MLAIRISIFNILCVNKYFSCEQLNYADEAKNGARSHTFTVSSSLNVWPEMPIIYSSSIHPFAHIIFVCFFIYFSVRVAQRISILAHFGAATLFSGVVRRCFGQQQQEQQQPKGQQRLGDGEKVLRIRGAN